MGLGQRNASCDGLHRAVPHQQVPGHQPPIRRVCRGRWLRHGGVVDARRLVLGAACAGDAPSVLGCQHHHPHRRSLHDSVSHVHGCAHVHGPQRRLRCCRGRRHTGVRESGRGGRVLSMARRAAALGSGVDARSRRRRRRRRWWGCARGARELRLRALGHVASRLVTCRRQRVGRR